MDDILTAGIDKCLVYSFGIADEWGFDKDMGAIGCEVYAFDPTVSLPEKLAPNVIFHKWGLFGGSRNDSAAMKFENNKYGKIDGEMYHLGEIIYKLGHQGRNISIFKIDCEGCEWEVFGYMHAGSWSQVGRLTSVSLSHFVLDSVWSPIAWTVLAVGSRLQQAYHYPFPSHYPSYFHYHSSTYCTADY
jgi:hypothetical protein